MTVAIETTKQQANGDGATTVFGFPSGWDVKNKAHVRVIKDTGTVRTILVVDVDYTVSLTSSTITMTVAPAIGTTITIRLYPPLKQEGDLRNRTEIDLGSHEDLHDARQRQILRHEDDILRAIKFPESEIGSLASTELPSVVARANRVLYFDASGAMSLASGASIGVGGFTPAAIPFASGAGLLTEDTAAFTWTAATRTLNLATSVAFPSGWNAIKLKNIDSGQPSFFTIGQSWSDNPSGRDDTYITIGYNFDNITQNREVLAEPAIFLQLESYVDNGGPNKELEAHVTILRSSDGSVLRPWSVRYDRTTERIMSLVFGADLYAFQDGNGTAGMCSVGIGISPNPSAALHVRYATSPLLLEDAGGAVNNKYWDFAWQGSGALSLRAVNDAYGAAGNALTFTRSGTTITGVQVGSRLIWDTDNANDIGTAGANRARDIYWARQLRGPDGALATPSYSFSSQTDFGFRYVTTNYMALVGSSVNLMSFSSLGFVNRAGQYLGWASSGDATGTVDLQLHQEAPNILAQRNGVSAQAAHFYNTYTSSTNYERGIVSWAFASNILWVGTEKGSGGGTARALSLGTDSTSRWDIGATSGHFTAGVDNTYDIGASGATRPRTLYAGTSIVVGTSPAAAGIIRLANNTTISFRNAANSADITGLTVDGSNHISIGSNTGNITIQANSGNMVVNSSILCSVATPASFGTSQNNFALASGSVVFRLDATAGALSVTGFTGGTSGRIVVISNIGANNFSITNEDGASTAGNRVITGTGATLTLAVNQSVTLWYDSTTARWRVVKNA